MAIVSIDGKLITFDVPTLDGSLVTGLESGKSVTVSCTSLGYTGTVLGTVNRSFKAEFVSASGANPMTVTLRMAEPVHLGDTVISVLADASAFYDGTTSSAEVSDTVSTNDSTTPYPQLMANIVGIMESGEYKIAYSAISGVATFEAVAIGPYALGESAAAVKFELTDGTNTVSAISTSMQRSAYNPSKFYSAAINAGLISTDPFTANSGGSGVFAVNLDPSTLNDGAVTLTVTAYPFIGNAATVRTVTWELYNETAVPLTPVDIYIDSRASAPYSSLTGTPIDGEPITTAAGAAGRLRYTSGGVVYFSSLDATDFANGDLVTCSDSGATFTLGAVTYNGALGNAGTQVAPKRQLWASAPVGSLTEKYTVHLMGDAGIPTYYSMGRGSTGLATATWTRVVPYAGLSVDDIVIASAEGATYTDSRLKRLNIKGVTIYEGFRGDNARDTALWMQDYKLTSEAGRAGASGTWGFSEWGDVGGGGAFYTGGAHFNLDTNGISGATLVRDLSVDICNEDIVKSCGTVMELWGRDNDSTDASAHEDGIQWQDTADANRIIYNVALNDIVTQQIFLTDDINGAAMCNVLAVSANGGGVSVSQYGNVSAVHIVENFYISHITFVNAGVWHRTYAGSTDINAFLRYSVMTDFSGFDLTHAYLENHFTNASDNAIGITSALNQNPYVDGILPTANDDPLHRDFTPDSAELLNRVPVGGRHVAYDLFGAARKNDGTGSIGAIELTAVIAAYAAYLAAIGMSTADTQTFTLNEKTTPNQWEGEGGSPILPKP
ncbi:MAG: hypothetical protein ACRBB4_01355 [Neptuniibacter sp.]